MPPLLTLVAPFLSTPSCLLFPPPSPVSTFSSLRPPQPPQAIDIKRPLPPPPARDLSPPKRNPTTPDHLFLSLRAHTAIVNSVAWQPPRGDLLATGATDGTVLLWKITGALPAQSAAPPALPTVIAEPAAKAASLSAPVNRVSWRHDGRALALSSDDGTARVVVVPDGGPVAEIVTLGGPAGGRARGIAWRPDGSALAVAFDKAIHVFDMREAPWRPVAVLQEHSGAVTSLSWRPEVGGGAFSVAALSRRTPMLASASMDETVRVWDARSWKTTATLGAHQRYVSAVSWRPDGQALSSSSGDGVVRVFEKDGWRPVAVLRHDGEARTAAWRYDGAVVVTGSRDGKLRVWETKTWRAVGTIDAGGPVHSADWRQDGALVAAGAGSMVGVWGEKRG